MSVSDEKTTKKRSGWRPGNRSALGENVKVIVQALILALLIRTFLFQPFSIPSGSMMPTLLVGDYMFVSKYAYGYSTYSLPLSLDLFTGRIWASKPKRGDVVVFRLPSDPSIDYVKRLIGLPGDTIQVRDGVLYINGKAVPKVPDGTFRATGRYDTGRPVKVFKETLPNGVSYDTLDLTPDSPGDNTRVFNVPPGHYFMMGDNRDNSLDSRFADGGVGYVPFDNLVGRANIIFFSMRDDVSPLEFWKWPTDLRFDRLFKSAEH